MRLPTPAERIGSIPAYVPGRTAAEAEAEHGIGEAIKLASNESPFGPLPGVAEAVAASVDDTNRYADPNATDLAAAYAASIGVDPSRVAVGNGSSALLQQLAIAYLGDGGTAVFPWPSFIAYPGFTLIAGGTSRTVPLDHERFDVDQLVAAIDEATKVVFIANPNNPTGSSLCADELVRLVDAVPATALLVVDEAYREYTDASVPNAIELLGDRPNVVVVRTLSKAYGLAGLRVGFLVGDPQIAATINKCAIPFAVNVAGQAAATAALQQLAEVERRCAVVVDERRRVESALRKRGIGVPVSSANFWWLPAGSVAGELAAELERRGIVTRPLDGGVRVTVGQPADNDAFVAAFFDIVGPDVGDSPTLAEWGVGTGAAAIAAGAWIERLDSALARLAEHLDREHPGLTAPVPGESEQWDAGQVWAHLAEFGDYWLVQLRAVLAAASDEPVPFGRTRHDDARIAAIADGRHLDPAAHHATVLAAAARLRALLGAMTNADWSRTGKHETLGVMDLDAQLTHFHVGHYEEHADQLDSIVAETSP